MKRLANLIGNWGPGRLVVYIGLSMLLVILIAYPGRLAHAVDTAPTSTVQTAPSNVAAPTPTLTPEPEVETQVGLNAGLVCGAVVLVIIIIAGLVRSARWMQERGQDAKGERE